MLSKISCKSALAKCGIEGLDYTINPYTGCSHCCRYCYADFMRRFSGHKEKWGSFVDAKMNIAEVLEKELDSKKPGLVWLSSVTDPYQPAEKELGLTHKILECFASHKNGRKFGLQVLTKSVLVERDFALLKGLGAEVGFSITGDDSVSRIFEPFASPNSARIACLKKARDFGLNAYAFFGPVLPGLTDLGSLFSGVAGNANYVFVEALNSRPTVISRVLPVYEKFFPESVSALLLAVKGKASYFASLEEEARRLSSKHVVALERVVLH